MPTPTFMTHVLHARARRLIMLFKSRSTLSLSTGNSRKSYYTKLDLVSRDACSRSFSINVFVISIARKLGLYDKLITYVSKLMFFRKILDNSSRKDS